MSQGALALYKRLRQKLEHPISVSVEQLKGGEKSISAAFTRFFAYVVARIVRRPQNRSYPGLNKYFEEHHGSQ
jgi:hypothetical protein